MKVSFAARVADRSAVIGIVGLGYVGMPMAMAYARAGFSGELARRIRDHLASSSEVVNVPYTADYPHGFEDTRRRVPDVTRARDELGFVAAVPFEEGLARTLEWCRSSYAVAGGSR